MEGTSVPARERYHDYESALTAVSLLEEELIEFQRSSYELESQLEDELKHMEDTNQKLHADNENHKLEIINLKKEITQSRQELLQQRKDLSLKLTKMETSLIQTQAKLIETEIENDTIQQTERAQATLILDLQTDLQAQEEKSIILNAEVEKLKAELITLRLENSNLQNQISNKLDIKPQTIFLSTPITQQYKYRIPSESSSSSGGYSNDDENIDSIDCIKSKPLPKGRSSKLSTPLTPLAGKSKSMDGTPSSIPTSVKLSSKRHSSPVMAHLHNLIHRQSSQSKRSSVTPSKSPKTQSSSTQLQIPRTVSIGSNKNYGGLVLPKNQTGQTTTKITNTNVLTASTHIKLESVSGMDTNNETRRHSSMNFTEYKQSQKTSSPLSNQNINDYNDNSIIEPEIWTKNMKYQRSPSNPSTPNLHNGGRFRSLHRRLSSSKFMNWIGDSNTSSPRSPSNNE